jgi:hypothetical protein
MPTDLTKQSPSRPPLPVNLLRAALRYEEMTAAVLQSVGFFGVALAASTEHEVLGKEITGFDQYLKPQSLTFPNFFAGMLLGNLIAEVENYFVEVMKNLLLEFPKKLSATQFTLAEVLDSPAHELVLRAAESRLAKLMYKRPAEYVAELADILSVEATPFAAYWPAFIEAKARRDLGMHNAWQINDTYRRKVIEAGLHLPPNVGPSMVPDFDYLRRALHDCDKMVRNIHEQLEAKFMSPHKPLGAKEP